MEPYKVAEGTQVHHDGTTYGSGAKLPALEPDTADQWLKAGWIEPVKKASTRK